MNNISGFARKVKDEQIEKMMRDEQNKNIDVSTSTKKYADATASRSEIDNVILSVRFYE